MKRPTIKSVLIGIFALLAVLFGVTSFVAIDGIKVLNTSMDNYSSNIAPSIEAAKNIQLARLQMRGGFEDLLLSETPQQIASGKDAVQQKEMELDAALQTYEPLISSDAERASYSALVPLAKQYVVLGHQMIDLTVAGKQSDARALFMNVMSPLAVQISAKSEELIAFNQKEGKAAVLEGDVAYDNTLFVVYSVLAATAAIVAGSAYFALVGIAKPVQTITASMTALAGGDTQSAIPFSGRADEIGAMASAVEVFRQAAVANRCLEAEAEAARAQAESDRVRLGVEAEEAAQARLNEATAGLAAGLKRLAAGDLAFELTDPFAPDFEALRHDLNGAVAQLRNTLRTVAHSTTSIDTGSREISQSAEDLSRRTEQQAASLEETAAALDQITVNVSNSSKRADEARTISIEANRSAAHSGSVVADAVNAMQRIETSSTKISNIIGVIDEIAFQTNLLALNAGVEAARAGEAGRGFAVVAQEVRELAQRSATAAKEIKDLISNSTSEVESGVKLVRDTGEALKTIEQHIVTINRHMEAIATSAREQSTGLSEVNSAVNQMDQVTQQNAAMVEQTNAAGSTLANEAGRLRELISQFHLDDRAPKTTSNGYGVEFEYRRAG
ncbi:HAMP domain-containing methyl-accepting chemotaxis protein [Rhizobium sp. S163]|uniref:methyl-accepting chemotaxis protein n=1 Tax=Rhizobium sp. S163 TaxID=3055039 RepID=UPI0025A9A0EF|nr:HAMP domain-containing methyl-accepting chemotaxis protein [Rhizobium sp. S163]MDM9649417.1 HAMP domain-containing methyl-accepting chemotaxis protein [Rhizobium sp. S163]